MMDLFNSTCRPNILPCDGEAIYYGPVMSTYKAQHYFTQLLKTIAWRHDEVVIFGKRIVTSRKVAWYGDANYRYRYSRVTRQALTWTTDLLALKSMVEDITGLPFNACLLNLYHNGSEGLAWHSDNEKPFGKHPVIASLSFGTERKFSFKHKHKPLLIPVILERGSLLLMKGTTQTHWLHSLPPMKKTKTARINLTFRTFLS